MHKSQMIDPPARAEVVQLDDARLEACGPLLRAELLAEAAMLAEAFAPAGGAKQLLALAATLAADARGQEMGGARARQLACALRCRARGVGL